MSGLKKPFLNKIGGSMSLYAGFILGKWGLNKLCPNLNAAVANSFKAFGLHVSL